MTTPSDGGINQSVYFYETASDDNLRNFHDDNNFNKKYYFEDLYDTDSVSLFRPYRRNKWPRLRSRKNRTLSKTIDELLVTNNNKIERRCTTVLKELRK